MDGERNLVEGSFFFYTKVCKRSCRWKVLQIGEANAFVTLFYEGFVILFTEI